MTLCIAWIREAEPNKELVFATDSCLSGGERWDNGIKLFDLPRRDALICFTGRTDRAYPLILNLVSSLRYNKEFQDNSKDVTDLALYVTELFTELVLLITDTAEPIDDIRSGAEFLFGGWSWKKRQFILLKIYYEKAEKKFTYRDCIDTNKYRKFVFLGDHTAEAETLYHKEFEGDRSGNLLDMEPLKVLAVMSRDPENYTTISGAPQIAKVYENGNTEFFGIVWPSIKSKPHFLGKEFSPFDKPDVRYFDPDTFVLCEILLPEALQEIPKALFNQDTNFVESCYPSGRLKKDITAKEKKRLIEVLRSVAYQQFLDSNAQSDEIEFEEQPQEQEQPGEPPQPLQAEDVEAAAIPEAQRPSPPNVVEPATPDTPPNDLDKNTKPE